MSKQRRFSRAINVQLYKEDYDRLREGLSKSTCRTFSEYCRKLLLWKQVTYLYRNESLDAFINEAIRLRKEMQEVRKGVLFTKDGEIRLLCIQEGIKIYIYKIFEYVSQDKSH